MKIQESKVLTAKSLINYTKLKPIKYSVFDDNGEYMFRRVNRPGCPLSEKDLKRQLIDCTSSIMKDLGMSFERRSSLLRGLNMSKVESVGMMLEIIIAK